jgi:hypothetical protein
VLGFAFNPGLHEIGVKYRYFFRKNNYTFTSTIGRDGYRITSDHPELYRNKPQIWIFGCSYTYGWSLNDEETFPWLVQENLPNYHIRNLGIGGQGNVVALLQLREELVTRKPPAFAIFVYNPFHLVRNVAAPSFVNNELAVLTDNAFHFPKAFINEEGKLNVTLIPVEPVDEPEPTLKNMRLVTELVFQEIKHLCDTHSIVPILAFQTGDRLDPIVQDCEQKGFNIIDMSLDLSSKYQAFPPFDPHPNVKAHKIYADKLLVGLREIIQLQKD